MKQETTIFNADYCFFSLKGRCVLVNQISCDIKKQVAGARLRAFVGKWNRGMIFDVCGVN